MKLTRLFRRNDFLPVILLISLNYILAPLTPNQPVDPWGIFNPQKFIKIMVIIGLIQMLSIFLNRAMGTRTGTLMSSFLSGFISSTAIFLQILSDSRKETHINKAVLAAGLAATIGSLIELQLLLYYSSKSLFESLKFPLSTVTLILFVINYLSLPNKDENHHTLKQQDFFDIVSFLKLTFIFAGLIATVKFTQELLGDAGSALLSFVAGLFELHAMSLANANLHEQGLVDLLNSKRNIIIAVLASLVSKCGLAIIISRNKTGLALSLIYFIFTILSFLVLTFF